MRVCCVRCFLLLLASLWAVADEDCSEVPSRRLNINGKKPSVSLIIKLADKQGDIHVRYFFTCSIHVECVRFGGL